MCGGRERKESCGASCHRPGPKDPYPLAWRSAGSVFTRSVHHAAIHADSCIPRTPPLGSVYTRPHVSTAANPSSILIPHTTTAPARVFLSRTSRGGRGGSGRGRVEGATPLLLLGWDWAGGREDAREECPNGEFLSSRRRLLLCASSTLRDGSGATPPARAGE